MLFTDSHCHLDFPEFEDNLAILLSACAAKQIHRIIVPSIAPNNWQKVLTLVNNNNSSIKLFAALGIHPWFLNELSDADLTQLTTYVQQHKTNIIAIGEAGIDGKIAEQNSNLSKQLHFFD